MKFTVHMPPVAKARARTIVRAGKVHSFTPRTTEKAEWEIRQAIILAAGSGAAIHKPTPIWLTVAFFLPRPKSLSRRVKLPVSRPDLDNLVKTVKDALKGYAWDDDSQVTTLAAQKHFGSPPRIDIYIVTDLEEHEHGVDRD